MKVLLRMRAPELLFWYQTLDVYTQYYQYPNIAIQFLRFGVVYGIISLLSLRLEKIGRGSIGENCPIPLMTMPSRVDVLLQTE